MRQWIVIGLGLMAPLAWAQSEAVGEPETALESVAAVAESAGPRVTLMTSKGPIVVELYPDRAPASAANFLAYAEAGFYDGTIFHRVIDGFMIQGGGFTEDLVKKRTRDPIRNEADNGLLNLRGTLAMARTSSPHSATAQFYINLADNPPLDHRSPDARGWGYAVFGRVVEGMGVVDAIAAVPTGNRGTLQNVPVEAVKIFKTTVDSSGVPIEATGPSAAE